jgi:hypothetical protein
MLSMLLSRSSNCWAPARRHLALVRSRRYLVRSSADGESSTAPISHGTIHANTCDCDAPAGFALQGPRYSSQPDDATQESHAPAAIDSYAQYSDLSTSSPASDDGAIEITTDALNSAISYPGDASGQEMPPPPSVQYNPGAANVALVTGIVLDVKQDSESMGLYAVTLTLAIPAFGAVRPQHVQVPLPSPTHTPPLRPGKCKCPLVLQPRCLSHPYAHARWRPGPDVCGALMHNTVQALIPGRIFPTQCTGANTCN